MKVFYGWIIVGVGMVVTCVGFGALFSLGVFLQPMSEAVGWSRTGISTAALLNFLCIGVGSFVWGAFASTRSVCSVSSAFQPPPRAPACFLPIAQYSSDRQQITAHFERPLEERSGRVQFAPEGN